MYKLNAVILLVLLTIAICNSIAIKKLNDEVFWPEGIMKPLNK
tara:strand:- start:3710 stop:3838 length:129 start_codon:yes stop_codon:yes gene_type:complete